MTNQVTVMPGQEGVALILAVGQDFAWVIYARTPGDERYLDSDSMHCISSLLGEGYDRVGRLVWSEAGTQRVIAAEVAFTSPYSLDDTHRIIATAGPTAGILPPDAMPLRPPGTTIQ